MAKKLIYPKYHNDERVFRIVADVILWNENDVSFQYSPQLDLTGYGKSATEAQSSFDQTLKDFISYSISKDTLFDELKRLGWITDKKKNRIRAPEENQLLENNEPYKNLLKIAGITRATTNLIIPI